MIKRDPFQIAEKEFKDDPEYIADGILLGIVHNIDCDYKDLAAWAGISESMARKVMNAGEPRVSILTLVKVAQALGKELVCEFRDKEKLPLSPRKSVFDGISISPGKTIS